MKIGIIGLGHLHPRSYMAHFQAIPGAEVVAVVEAVTGADGVAALQVVEAIYRADQEKRWVGVKKI